MVRKFPDTAYKFYLVMPMEEGFAGSEGAPEAGFPCTEFCHIRYSRSDAESLMLELQDQWPDREYVLLESSAWCEQVPYWACLERPVYRLAEPQPWE